MTKTILVLRFVLLSILPFVLITMSGCATTPEEQGKDREPWAGKMTGQIDADLEMFFSRLEEEQEVYLVNGAFKGNIARVSGGYGSGTMSGGIKGKVKDGIFNVQMWGRATVSDGSASFKGKMIGTLSKSQAFGTWEIIASDDETTYNFTGEWRADKIGSASQDS